MNVVLVKPPLIADAVFDPLRTTQPLGLWYVASHLRRKGHSCCIVDAVMEASRQVSMPGSDQSYRAFKAQALADFDRLSPAAFVERYSPFRPDGRVERRLARVGLDDRQLAERVAELRPDLVGISFFASCNHLPGVEAARAIRERLPEVRIAAGGLHATDMAEQVLRDGQGAIDYVVRGDGQVVMEALAEGVEPAEGIAFLREGRLVDRGVARDVKMDELALIEPALLADTPLPQPPMHTYPTGGRRYVDFMFSRGCKLRCSFCRNQRQYDRHSFATLDRQLALFAAAGYQELVIQDDALLEVKTDFFEALRLIARHGFRWQDNGGVSFDDLDDEFVDAIIGYGNCTALYVPVNPRNPAVVEPMRKYSSQPAFTRKVDLLRRLKDSGIFVQTSGIYGTPHQTRESAQHEIERYVQLVERGYVDQSLVFADALLPGTRDHREHRSKIHSELDWYGYSIFTPHASTEHMTIQEVEATVVAANQALNSVQAVAGHYCSAFPKPAADFMPWAA